MAEMRVMLVGSFSAYGSYVPMYKISYASAQNFTNQVLTWRREFISLAHIKCREYPNMDGRDVCFEQISVTRFLISG